MINATNIKQLAESGQGQIKVLPLDLAIALTDQTFNIVGTQFGLWNAPNATDVVYVRFNGQSNPQIPFRRGQVLRTPFHSVYITIPGTGTGIATFVYGTGEQSILHMMPNISEANEAIEDIRDELVGDTVEEGFGESAVGLVAVAVIAANVNRKACCIQAKWNNAGIIYVGFDNTVTAANYAINLAAGEAYTWDDYRGDVYAIASIAAQNVGWGEW